MLFTITSWDLWDLIFFTVSSLFPVDQPCWNIWWHCYRLSVRYQHLELRQFPLLFGFGFSNYLISNKYFLHVSVVMSNVPQLLFKLWHHLRNYILVIGAKKLSIASKELLSLLKRYKNLMVHGLPLFTTI